MWATILAGLKTAVTHRITWIIIGCLAGLALVVWLVMYAESCHVKSQRERAKEAINAKLETVANREAVIANLQQKQIEDKANVNAAIHDYVNTQQATNAQVGVTDQKLEEANQAVANLQKAQNANQTNVSVQDLQEKLKGL